MMKTLFPFSALFLVSTFQAQVTITKAFNDPIIGDIVNNYNVAGTVDNTSSGSNAQFNNATLSKGSLSVSSYSIPSASETVTFPGSTIKMIDEANIIFYKSSLNKLEITGLVTGDATLNFSADNGTVITYPASFGYTETDNGRGSFSSSSGSGLFKGTITNTADATGTLYIGSKVYNNVLRIKSVQNFNLYQTTDTNYLFSIGTITNSSFLYYDNIHKFPLLSSTNGNLSIPILNINQSTSQARALDVVFLSTDNVTKKNVLLVAPNPVKNQLKILGVTPSEMIIYDLSGRILLRTDRKTNLVDVSTLKKGNYILQFNLDNKENTTLIFIKN